MPAPAIQGKPRDVPFLPLLRPGMDGSRSFPACPRGCLPVIHRVPGKKSIPSLADRILPDLSGVCRCPDGTRFSWDNTGGGCRNYKYFH